jgi:hypothetical protein
MNHSTLKQEHEETELDKINISNLELYKSQSKSQKEAIRKIFFACLKELPRDLVIEALKDKKFIKRDWEKNGEKYVERK